MSHEALCGLRIYVQALQVDPGAAKGVSFTPGLDLLLGRWRGVIVLGVLETTVDGTRW